MRTWKDIAVVTGRDFQLSLGEAITCWKGRGLFQDLLKTAAADKFLRETARREHVTVAPAELQAEADRYRGAHGLHSAERTETWLRQCGLTVNDLEAAVERELIVAKLMAQISTDAIQAHFAREKMQFARVHLWQLTIASEGAAHELLTQLTEEGADFAELARTHSLDPAARTTGGDLGVLQRWLLPAHVAEEVFAASPGQIVGPLTTDGGVHLFRVTELLPAELDARTARTIRQQLFDTWLQQELQALQLTFPVNDES